MKRFKNDKVISQLEQVLQSEGVYNGLFDYLVGTEPEINVGNDGDTGYWGISIKGLVEYGESYGISTCASISDTIQRLRNIFPEYIDDDGWFEIYMDFDC